jgi:hypothetical protein
MLCGTFVSKCLLVSFDWSFVNDEANSQNGPSMYSHLANRDFKSFITRALAVIGMNVQRRTRRRIASCIRLESARRLYTDRVVYFGFTHNRLGGRANGERLMLRRQ